MKNQRLLSRERVARLVAELGELAREVTVVGGTSPALYPMNETVIIRPTEDIDVLVRTRTTLEWQRLVHEIQARGFRHPPGEPICRYEKGDLIVDLMPTDPSQLGFGNRWYEDAALKRISAIDGSIHVVSPLYFVATKLDAYASRGGSDPYNSHDFEDIVVVLRGLPDLITDIATGSEAVHEEIRRALETFVSRDDALDMLRMHFAGDRATQATVPVFLEKLKLAVHGRVSR